MKDAFLKEEQIPKHIRNMELQLAAQRVAATEGGTQLMETIMKSVETVIDGGELDPLKLE